MRRSTIAFTMSALAALVFAGVLAAPLPPRRPAPVAAAAARAMLAHGDGEPASALESACGTRLDAMPGALAAAAARALVDPLPTPHSTDAGEIAALEDDGTFFYTNSGGQPLHDVAATARAFYRTHGDDYDFLAIYLASGTSEWLGSPGALAAAWVVMNDTEGIGLSQYDDHMALGLPPRSQALLTMNGLHRYPSDPDAGIGGPGDSFSTMDVIAHEFAHRWLAYVAVDSAGSPVPALLGRAYQHWNFFFDNEASYMEGCDWAQVGPDSFRTVDVSSRFGSLDQYLMGVRSKAETPPFFVVNEPYNYDPPGTYIPTTTPFVGLGARGRATTWQVSDIESAEGVRVPAAGAAPNHFRVAFVLVTPRGSDATPADLAKLEVIRSRFPSTISTSTAGRMTVDVSLDSRTGHVAIAHTPLGDTENTSNPRPVGAKVTIAQEGTPIALVPSSVTLYWRPGTSGAFTAMPMAAAGPDSFAASLPAEPAGTTVQYWLYASSDQGGNDARLPAAGAAAPFAYHVGPDVTAPLVQHTPVPFQSRNRMPLPLLAGVTDNLGLDSVWCEVRINGGPLVATGAAHVGRDSFTVSIGSGVTTGGRIAYRFVARDRAAVANLGYSNSAFDTIRVGHDWFDDFENPSLFFHAGVLYSWRDAWELEQGVASPAGGVAWHCGNAGDVPYSPHTDAALYSSLVYDITPGTTLTFDHRYDLEQSDASHAWDAARVEVSQNNGPWLLATPQVPYSHIMRSSGMPFPKNSLCWSGTSATWRTETIDLSSYAPGPVRVRLRMCSDEFLGGGGWWVDRVRVHFPDDAQVGVPMTADAAALGPAWPNPARESLRQSLALARASAVEWELFDISGRRVASLWRGTLEAGRHELAAPVPQRLAGGLYYARLSVGGRILASPRIAVVR